MGKIVQKVKNLSMSQKSGLSLKLDSARQNEFKGKLGFQNKVPEVYKPKFHVKRCNELTLENAPSNGSSF